MSFVKILYVIIILLLYAPMVFLGANVFFPKYADDYREYVDYDDCNIKYPYAPNLAPEQRGEIETQRQACFRVQERVREQYQEEKRAYDGWKYIFIIAFNLVILLLALFIAFNDAVILGLFVGAVVATFIATIQFFRTNSKIGFVLLVLTFFAAIFFINKRKEAIFKWKKKK